MSINEIYSDKLYEQIKTGKKLKLVDVRTPAEYGAAHIEGSKNIPLGSTELSKLETSEEIVFICQGGARAKNACSEFIQKAGANAQVLSGGIKSWQEARLPIIKGSGAISLERQVRIAAGFLVLVGSILTAAINSNFLILPAFVGAGLMFAGITDTCGMAMLLAKMPWNNNCNCKSSCGSK